MKSIGIPLIILGVVGLAMSTIMFGDIGIAAGLAGIIGIISGIGFIKIKK